MILLAELNKKNLTVDNIIESNLLTLCRRLNIIREAWGKPMIITSGLRDQKHQDNLIKSGLSKATKSRHLIGAAADVLDEDGTLKAWLRAHPEILGTAGLWCEHWDATPTWVHFQIVPPASGSLWFFP
jgi:uncharacterized protein YcbK (DUF882 family)